MDNFKVSTAYFPGRISIDFFTDLMRDPILQEKRLEHVSFQKYALELLERLSGKTKHTNNGIDASLINIHRVCI